MAKDAYFFSHDYGARNDPKLQKVLMKLGHEGKGIYWDIIEMLFEENGKLPYLDIETISFAIRASSDKLNSLINDFDLFENDGEFFWSNSVINRLQKREEKTKKYSEAAKNRWEKTGTELKMDKSQFYILHCWNEFESFIKMGITSEYVSRRYSGKKMPYNYEILIQYFSDDFLSIEQEFNDDFFKYKYIPKIPFGGANECYDLRCYKKILSKETRFKFLKKQNNCTESHYNLIEMHLNRNAIKGKERKIIKFIPPSKEEVEIYFKELNSIDKMNKFLNHYTSNGWMVGKNKMKDWKAAARNSLTWGTLNYQQSKKAIDESENINLFNPQ